MPRPDEEYFNWLCARVQRAPAPLYFDLLLKLFRTEFTWKHPRDENRLADGADLRLDFERATGRELEHGWHDGDCSILEMLIAFSSRAEFLSGKSEAEWFWKIIENLDLDGYRQMQDGDIPVVEDILYNLVWRQYRHDGYGGMFPLRWPKRDQRDIEIWYQFCDYVDEEQLI